MSGGHDSEGEVLAQWLKEAGRRAQSPARSEAKANGDDTYNSPASLHRYVEELAGRKLQTHAEVLEFLKEVAGSQPQGHREHERRRMVREVALIVALALSYLHFYYWEVQLEIAALNSVRVVLPAIAVRTKSI
ncbi:MAG TPA: hypothetical protein VLA30_16655 [Burkholderiales bacterium]|nr:hypothetical protein [Burkholderiales bacterium]